MTESLRGAPSTRECISSVCIKTKENPWRHKIKCWIFSSYFLLFWRSKRLLERIRFELLKCNFHLRITSYCAFLMLYLKKKKIIKDYMFELTQPAWLSWVFLTCQEKQCLITINYVTRELFAWADRDYILECMWQK